MKKGRLFSLMTGVVGLTGLTAYTHLVEGRSMRSWVIERLFWAADLKSQQVEQNQDQFDAFLKEKQAISDTPFDAPDKVKGYVVDESTVDGMQVFTLNDKQDPKQRVILYMHGGAYVSQPTTFHFQAVANIAKKLDAKVVFPIYPKAPRYTYQATYPKMETVYQNMLSGVESAHQVTFMGDSAGGGLALGFAMYARDNELPQPKDIVLLSPWLDVKTDHPEIANYESVDPMLSAWGIHQMGRAWAGSEEAMEDPYVSPIFGDFNDLGKLSIFVGTHEILLPDNDKFHHMLNEKGIAHHYRVDDRMNHVYALYPIPEAKSVQEETVEIIREG